MSMQLFEVTFYEAHSPCRVFVVAEGLAEVTVALSKFGAFHEVRRLTNPAADGLDFVIVLPPDKAILLPTPMPPASKGEKASLTPTVPNVKEVPDYEPAVTFYNADTGAARLVSGDIDSGPTAPPPVVEKAAEAPATDKPVSDPLHRPWMDSEFRNHILRNVDERWERPNLTQAWEQLIADMSNDILDYGCAVLWLVRDQHDNPIEFRRLPANQCTHHPAAMRAFPHGYYQCDHPGATIRIDINNIRVYKS